MRGGGNRERERDGGGSCPSACALRGWREFRFLAESHSVCVGAFSSAAFVLLELCLGHYQRPLYLFIEGVSCTGNGMTGLLGAMQNCLGCQDFTPNIKELECKNVPIHSNLKNKCKLLLYCILEKKEKCVVSKAPILCILTKARLGKRSTQIT